MKKFLIKMVWEQIRYKNKKNVPIIVVLVLAMFLILQVFCLFDIYVNMTIQDAKESNGSYHVHFVDLLKDVEPAFGNASQIDKIGFVSKPQKVGIENSDISSVEKNQKFKWYVMDPEAYELSEKKLLCGRLPVREDEVVVSSNMKRDGVLFYQGFSQKRISDEITSAFQDSKKTFRGGGVIDSMVAGKKGSACYIAGWQKSIENPKEAYVTLTDHTRKSIYQWVSGLGYDYKTQVYDTQYMKKHGLAYTGNYAVELNNYYLDALNGESTAEGVILAKRLVVVIPLVVTLIAAMMLMSAIFIELDMTKKENGFLRVCGFSPKIFTVYYLVRSTMLFIPSCLIALLLSEAGKRWIVYFAQTVRMNRLKNFTVVFHPREWIWTIGIVYGVLLLSTILPVLVSLRSGVVDMLKGEAVQSRLAVLRWNWSDKIKGWQEWKIAGHMLKNHKVRTVSIMVSLALVGIFAMTYMICFQVIGQRIRDQKESYRSEFTLVGDDQVDAGSLLKQIPYVSWSDMIYDSIENCKNDGISLNTKMKESCTYWFGEDEMKVEVCSMSEEFYRKYFSPTEGKLPDYAELVEKEQGILCDYRQADANGKKVSGNVFSKVPASFINNKGEKTDIAQRGILKDADNDEGVTMPMLFVPEKVYLQKYTPLYTLIYFNAEKGKEQETRAWLIEHQDDLPVTVGDQANEYLAMQDTTNMLEKILFGALVIMITISFINMANTFVMDARMQKKDYAVLQALGMWRGRLYLIILGQCIGYTLLGLIGSGVYLFFLLPGVLDKLVNIQLQNLQYPVMLQLMISGCILVAAFVTGICSLESQLKKGMLDVLRKE